MVNARQRTWVSNPSPMPWGQTWPRPTLLVNAPQAIPNALGVRVTRGIVLVVLAFNRRMSARCAARFCINQQSHDILYLGGE
jgi:hypothetical protein